MHVAINSAMRMFCSCGGRSDIFICLSLLYMPKLTLSMLLSTYERINEMSI